MTIHLPTWSAAVIAALSALWLMLTLVASATTKITDVEIADASRFSPRFGWFLKLCRHWGMDVWPGIVALVNIFKGTIHLVPALGVLCFAIAAANGFETLSCSAPQTVTFPNWQITVQIGLQGAGAEIPNVERRVASSAHMTDAQKSEARRLLESVRTDGIPRAEHDVAAYSQFGGMSRQCQAYASIDLVAGDLTSAIGFLDAAGEPIPPETIVAVTTIAAYADALAKPACVATVGVNPSATARLRARLVSHGSSAP